MAKNITLYGNGGDKLFIIEVPESWVYVSEHRYTEGTYFLHGYTFIEDHINGEEEEDLFSELEEKFKDFTFHRTFREAQAEAILDLENEISSLKWQLQKVKRIKKGDL